MDISRRALAQLALTGVAAAQQAEADDLEQARQQAASNSGALLKHEVSMATEPAFLFKA